MRCVLPLLVLGSSLITDGWAQRKGSPKHTSVALNLQTEATGSVSVELIAAPDGPALAGSPSGQQALDLGPVSYGAGARGGNVQVDRHGGHHFVVRAKFGLRIQDKSQRFSSATLLASIAYPDTVFNLSVDGVKMVTTPQIIQPQARLGPVVAHRLEIEVPVSATEKNAQLRNAILFQVVPN